jgi:hypothetical protein
MRKISIFLFLGFLIFAKAWALPADDYATANDYFNHADWEKAETYYKRVIDNQPQNWQAYQGLGDCEYHLGNQEKAMAYYKISLSQNPNNPDLQYFVAVQNQHPTAGAQPPLASEIQSADAPTLETQSIPTTETQAPGASPVVPTATPAALASLPHLGSVDFRADIGVGFPGLDDFNNFYGSSLVDPSTVMADFNLDVNVDFSLGPNFQLGPGLVFLIKKPVKITETGGGLTETDEWNEQVIGGGLNARLLWPVGNNGNLVFGAQLGIYALASSTVNVTLTNGSATNSGTINLTGSNVGGLLEFKYEKIADKSLAWEIGLGYRILTFSPVQGSISTGQTETLPNANGSNAAVDFSGLELTASLLLM